MRTKLFGPVFTATLAMLSLLATSMPTNAATSVAAWETVGGVTATLPCFPCVAHLGEADVFGSIAYIGTIAGGPVGTGSVGIGGPGTSIWYGNNCLYGIASGTLGSGMGTLLFASLQLGMTAVVVAVTGTTALVGALVLMPVGGFVDLVLRCAAVPPVVLGVPTGASATGAQFSVSFTGAGVIVGV